MQSYKITMSQRTRSKTSEADKSTVDKDLDDNTSLYNNVFYR